MDFTGGIFSYASSYGLCDDISYVFSEALRHRGQFRIIERYYVFKLVVIVFQGG